MLRGAPDAGVGEAIRGGTRRSAGIPLAIRVGLNSGEVVVRSIGSDLHMDYTAVGQTTHLTTYSPIAMASQGHVYAWSGRIGEGISWLQQALTAYESAGTGFLQAIAVVQLGEAYLLADQVENVRACADRALMLARQRGERGHEAWAVRLLGETASHKGRPDVAAAEAHYGTAMALASELEMRPLLAHCHLGLGKLYRRTGDRATVAEHLTTATTMYHEMDMRFWLEQMQAEMTVKP